MRGKEEMRAFRILIPIVHTLSVLMMICMVANPSIFGFIIFTLSETHLSFLSIAVAILLLDGIALIVNKVVRSVLPVGSL